MKILQRLRDEKRAIAQKVNELNDLLGKEDRGMAPEERSQYTAWAKRDTELDEEIRAAEQFETSRSFADASDADIEARDRQRFEGSRRSFNPNDRDPAAPLTQFERSLALTTWALAGGSGAVLTDQGVACAQRMGLNLNHKTIELRFDRGADDNGLDFAPPRSLREAERQAEYRREIRNREIAEYRANPARYFETRAQSVGTGSAGGLTVPDEMMRPIEQALLQWGAMRQTSTIITTATGADLPIPTNDDSSNKGAIVGENTAVAEQDLTFAQLVLQAFKYSSKMIRVSVELLQDSATNLPAFLGTALGTRIGRITNDHFTTGTGSGQPNGIVTAATSSGVTAGTAGAVSLSELLQLKHSVDPAYRDNGTFMWNDSTFRVVKSMVDTQGRPLWLPNLIPGEPPTYDGDRYVVNQSMAGGATAKGIIYGDLSKYLIREVRGITLQRLDERYAELHQVAFLAFARYDGDLLDAGTHPVKYMTLA